MHVTFIPTITVSLSADEWELYGTNDNPDRDRAAVRMSEAAGEALTLAWSALSGDTRVAQAMGLSESTLGAITNGMTLSEASTLAYRHWDAVADSLDGVGASDTEPRSMFSQLIEHYLRDSPAQALDVQNARRRPQGVAPARPRRPGF